MHIINLIQEHWESITTAAIAVYEVIIRLVPTSKSWSLFTLLGRLIPDKTTENEAR
jgi:hypothetical protein